MAYTIADLIEHAVDLVPERVALESGDRLRSYADLEARANALAHKLRELGVQPGDRVGLYSRNTIESVEAMVAIFHLLGREDELVTSYQRRLYQSLH